MAGLLPFPPFFFTRPTHTRRQRMNPRTNRRDKTKKRGIRVDHTARNDGCALRELPFPFAWARRFSQKKRKEAKREKSSLSRCFVRRRFAFVVFVVFV